MQDVHDYIGQSFNRLAEGRELVGTPASLRNVIEADHREVLGHAAPEFRARGIEEAEC